MKSIIEEIWYGNMVPMKRSTQATEEEEELVGLIERNRTKLHETLTNEQKALLEKYEDVVSELDDLYKKEAFEYGFKLGARMVIEVAG